MGMGIGNSGNGKNGNGNRFLSWEWVEMEMGMALWEWEGMGTGIVLPAHLQFEVTGEEKKWAVLLQGDKCGWQEDENQKITQKSNLDNEPFLFLR